MRMMMKIFHARGDPGLGHKQQDTHRLFRIQNCWPYIGANAGGPDNRFSIEQPGTCNQPIKTSLTDILAINSNGRDTQVEGWVMVSANGLHGSGLIGR